MVIEGLQSIDDLVDFDQKSFNLIMTKPGGMMDFPVYTVAQVAILDLVPGLDGNPAQVAARIEFAARIPHTIQQVAFVIDAKSATQLEYAMHMALYYEMTKRNLTVENMTWFPVLKQFKTSWTR